jgi:hypothetical protein
MQIHRWNGSLVSWAGLTLLVLVAEFGCSKGTSEKPVRPPVSVNIGTPKALFIGTGTGTSGSALVTAATSASATQLIRVNQDGTVEAVPFKDAYGATVQVQVTHVELLSSDYLWVEFSYNVADVTALVRLADGKIFDLTPLGVSLASAQVKGGYLFAVGDSTLYRITLSSMQAQPMNNPNYDSVALMYRPEFEVDHQLNVRVPLLSNQPYSGAYAPKIFFADNSVPVVDSYRTDDVPYAGYCSNTVPMAEVYAENGHFIEVCWTVAQDPTNVTSFTKSYFVRDISFTSSGTQFTDSAPVRTFSCAASDCSDETVLSVATTYTRHTLARYLPTTNGFFVMSSVAGAGIALAWTDMALPAITILSGDYGYWKSADSVYRINLTAGSTPELFVTSSNIINWHVAGGVLIYARYVTGTSIATYGVSAPGVTPVLLRSEDMQVQQIGELDPTAIGST